MRPHLDPDPMNGLTQGDPRLLRTLRARPDVAVCVDTIDVGVLDFHERLPDRTPEPVRAALTGTA